MCLTGRRVYDQRKPGNTSASLMTVATPVREKANTWLCILALGAGSLLVKASDLPDHLSKASHAASSVAVLLCIEIGRAHV